jgi:CRISPR/Cas system-associated endonuclease Cas1
VNQQEVFSDRETRIELSKEVIKGNKYNYSAHSSRDTSQNNLKHALRKEIVDNQTGPKTKRSPI